MKYLDLHLKKDLIRQTSSYQKKQDPNGNGKLKEKVEKMGGDLQLGSMESRNGAPNALESNRCTWVPQQELEWSSKWHREIRRQRSHSFGGTSYCPQNEDSDELGGIDSTDHEGNQE